MCDNKFVSAAIKKGSIPNSLSCRDEKLSKYSMNGTSAELLSKKKHRSGWSRGFAALRSEYMFAQCDVEAFVAERLTPGTLDLEVRDSSLARRAFSLDKELYSTLSFFTQVYKWVTGDILLGGNPAMD